MTIEPDNPYPIGQPPNELIADKEWKIISAAMARIENALNAHHEEG